LAIKLNSNSKNDNDRSTKPLLFSLDEKVTSGQNGTLPSSVIPENLLFSRTGGAEKMSQPIAEWHGLKDFVVE